MGLDSRAAWTSYAPTTKSTIKIADYYDPDGSRGIHALVVTLMSGGDCNVCGELSDLEQKTYTSPPTEYQRRGARILDVMQMTTLTSDVPPTIDDLLKHQAAHKITYDLALWSTTSGVARNAAPPLNNNDGGVPSQRVIDTRTMKIYRVIKGFVPGSTSIPALTTLLDSVGAPK